MIKISIFAPVINGRLAEWLGNGLQNRPQQFDSARRLHKIREFGRIAQLVRALR